MKTNNSWSFPPSPTFSLEPAQSFSLPQAPCFPPFVPFASQSFSRWTPILVSMSSF
jgi:hypothetical protein